MPSYSGNAFSLEEAHAAATTAGFKPSRLNNRNRFSFNSRACHVGGDSSQGSGLRSPCWAPIWAETCWATERRKTAGSMLCTSTATSTGTARPTGSTEKRPSAPSPWRRPTPRRPRPDHRQPGPPGVPGACATCRTQTAGRIRCGNGLITTRPPARAPFRWSSDTTAPATGKTAGTALPTSIPG